MTHRQAVRVEEARMVKSPWATIRSPAAAFALVPVLGAIWIVAAINMWAPGYWTAQGFPLDDAWIHAVYARELGRTGMLAFNPGIPATGETAPLWAVLLAAVHRWSVDVASAVMLTKAIGFTLHAFSAFLLGVGLRSLGPTAWLTATLVAVHPDLVAASISGMEVPLATLALSGALLAATAGSTKWVAVAGFATALARPEVAVIVSIFPAIFWFRRRMSLAFRLSISAGTGAAMAMSLVCCRNYLVSGMVLPATFHAKVSATSIADLVARMTEGFGGVLMQFTLVGSPVVAVTALSVALVLAVRPATTAGSQMASALQLTGLVFCATSFGLIWPVDPEAFYHQRYVTPGVFLLVSSIAPLAATLRDGLPPRVRTPLTLITTVVVAATMAQAAPDRFARMANDARNIDDVQVRLGKSLVQDGNPGAAWVVDAGAARFFGERFVVDLIGLNSPALLTSGAQDFLNTHPPRYLDVFPGWSSLAAAQDEMPRTIFETSTVYTVTSQAAMSRHVLVTCHPPSASGRLIVGARTFDFRCAGAD